MNNNSMKDCNGTGIAIGDKVSVCCWWLDPDAVESDLQGEVVYIESCSSYGIHITQVPDWLSYEITAGDEVAFSDAVFEGTTLEVCKQA